MEFATNQTYTAIGAGLEAWVSIAKSIRIATRGGMKYVPLKAGGSFIDTEKATSYYTGAGILVGILILTLLFTLFGCLGQCCALCCCMKKIKRNRKTKASTFQKACSLVWVVFIYLFFMVGALTSFTGGNALASSILNLKTAMVGTLNSTLNTVGGLSPAITLSFTNLNSIVGNAIDATVRSVNFNQLDDLGVTTSMSTLATSMRNTNTNKNNLWSTAQSFKTSMNTAGASITTIVTNVKSITATVTSWSSTTGISISGGTWRLTSPSISVGSLDSQADTVQTNFGSCPDGTSQLGPINTMPDLIAFANEIDALVGRLKTDVQSTIVSSTTSTKTSTNNALTSARNGITSSLDSMKSSLDGSIKPLIDTINDAFKSVEEYEGYRSMAMIILSSIIILILLIFTLFFITKKPAGVKGCNLVSSPLYLLIQLCAILLCILALAFGDVCSAVFEYSPPPIVQALDSSTATSITQAFTARDKCVANVSIIRIAGDLGLVNSAQVNVSKLAGDQIDAVDFSGVANSFNLGNSLSLSNSPTSQLSNLINLDTTQLVVTNFDTLITSLNTLITSLNQLKTNNGNARTASKTFATTGTVTNAQADADFITRSNQVDTSIDSVVASINTMVNTNIPGLKTSVTSLKTTADALKANAATVPATYTTATNSLTTFANNARTNLTNSIPNIKTNIKAEISVEETRLNTNLNCTELGNSLLNVQDSVCGRFVGGLDALWFAYAVLGLTAAISIPALIYAANRLLASTFKVDPESPILDKGADKGGDAKGKSAPKVICTNQKPNIKKTYPEESDPKGRIQITIH